MSMAAHQYALRERPFATTPEKPRRNKSFKTDLIELLRPDSYWPQPLTVERAFELMRWMISTGDQKYTSSLRWGYAGVAELLTDGGGLSIQQMKPIQSLEDLRHRLHHAILARPQSEGQIKWREDHNINVNATITVKHPTYAAFDGASHLGWRSEGDIIKALDAMLRPAVDRRMAASLNCVHKETVNWFHHVRIGIGEKRGFRFLLTYGERPSSPGASCWTDEIAVSRAGESFLDTMARARDVMALIIDGQANQADVEDMFRNNSYGDEFVRDQINKINAQ